MSSSTWKWRTALTDAATQSMKDKISKLLNMTVENGCTEDEQETALRMAAGLATRAGIELDSLRMKDQTAAERKATQKTFRQEFKIHQVMAAQAASYLYGCKLYTYSGGKGGIFFIGREENVELAEQTMFWLMRQVELLYKQHLPRGMTQRDRAEYRKTFKAACAKRVMDRAYQMMIEMRQNDRAAQAATGQNALVVQGYFEQLDRENSAYFDMTPEQKERAEQRRKEYEELEARRKAALSPRERMEEEAAVERHRKKEERAAARRKGPRARRMPVGNGTNAGYAAGDTVRLRKELE